MFTPFKEVKLDEYDMADIERQIDERAEKVGFMDAHNRSVLRSMLMREMKRDLFDNQDHTIGTDDEFAQRGER